MTHDQQIREALMQGAMGVPSSTSLQESATAMQVQRAQAQAFEASITRERKDKFRQEVANYFNGIPLEQLEELARVNFPEYYV